MDLLEYEGKDLFRKHRIPIPEAAVFDGNDVSVPGTDRIVVKAQVPVGKREEHGGIKLVDHDRAIQTAEEMLGSTVNGEKVGTVLLEEVIDIAEQYYISLSIDRTGKGYRLVFSGQGGSGIEERAGDALHHDFHALDEDELIETFEDRGVKQPQRLAEIAARMYDLMRQEDALLVEINPLVLTTGGDLIAVDSKVRIDESALFRHDIEERKGDDGTLSEDAEEKGLEFVDLDGTIGVIGNGAGLVMATLDSINHFGAKPANFLDIGGGADIETMTAAMEIVSQQENVEGMFVNIFGGITRCDHVAQGIIDFLEDSDIDLPMVVRMVGTNQEQGKQMLDDHGIDALDSMDDCAQRIVELTGGEPDADR